MFQYNFWNKNLQRKSELSCFGFTDDNKYNTHLATIQIHTQKIISKTRSSHPNRNELLPCCCTVWHSAGYPCNSPEFPQCRSIRHFSVLFFCILCCPLRGTRLLLLKKQQQKKKHLIYFIQCTCRTGAWGAGIA